MMTPQEAIKRIKDFGLYHATWDQPHSLRTVEAFKMAIEALASKIPRKIEMKEDKFGLSYHLYCPACETYFGEKGKHSIWLDEKPAYCCYCGQRLDWSDVYNIPK